MVVAAVVFGAMYVLGVRRLARRGRHWSAGRWVPFGAGVLVLAIASVLPESTFVVAHVGTRAARHGRADPARARRADHVGAAELESSDEGDAASRCCTAASRPCSTHPLVGWALFGGTLVAYYLSPLFQLSLEHSWLHAFVHLHFLVVGSLFLWPLVGSTSCLAVCRTARRLSRRPRRRSVPRVPRCRAAHDDQPIAPQFIPVASVDQHAAAGVLWASGELLTLVWPAIVFAQWWAADQREAVRLDRRLTASPP